MAKPKVDIHKLDQMVRSGKSVKEIAKFFGCTPGAISQHKKKCMLALSKIFACKTLTASLKKI
jgi:predicted transcriptional regulator